MRRRVLLLLLLPLAGCDNGALTLSVADAPVDGAERIVVQFDRVTLERDDGETETFEFAPPKSIDLLAFAQGDAAPLLSGERVDAGRYRAVILGIRASGDARESFVDTGSEERPLRLDPGDANLLRIATSFEIERGGDVTRVVDVDLRKSVRAPATAGGPFRLVPALRLHDVEDVGALAGEVAPGRVPSGCAPAVYVYAGRGVTPDDEGSATPPYASGIVRASGTGFSYSVEWLPAGEYTAAFTCDADADEAGVNDTIAFGSATDFSIEEAQTTRLNFP